MDKISVTIHYEPDKVDVIIERNRYRNVPHFYIAMIAEFSNAKGNPRATAVGWYCDIDFRYRHLIAVWENQLERYRVEG